MGFQPHPPSQAPQAPTAASPATHPPLVEPTASWVQPLVPHPHGLKISIVGIIITVVLVIIVTIGSSAPLRCFKVAFSLGGPTGDTEAPKGYCSRRAL